MLEDLSYINCRDLLESTGIVNVSESGGEISFSCPSAEHMHGDRSPSARMNSRTSAWICHNCGQRGNGITFLAWHKSIPETVARRLVEERYGGGTISIVAGTLEDEVLKIMNPTLVEEEKRIPPDESWLDKFKVDWEIGLDSSKSYGPHIEYMLDRGFSEKILNHFDIGYDKISDRITIPIFDQFDNLVGFKGRAWRDNTIPKYMILGDYNNQLRYGFQPYKKSKYVYNLSRPYQDGETHIIVEGELNAIAMTQHGFRRTVGIAGSEFSQIQCDLIKSYCDSAIIFLDNDKAGEKGTKKVVEMLSTYMSLKIVQNAPGDAADLDTQTVKELIGSAEPALLLQARGEI